MPRLPTRSVGAPGTSTLLRDPPGPECTSLACTGGRVWLPGAMSFFPPDPEYPEPEETDSCQPPWWAAPEDELPALFPVSEVLAKTDHVAILLVGAYVHRVGVELRIERRLRRNGLPAREWNELCATFMEHWPMGSGADPQGRLRFGVVLGDGERVLADDSPFRGGGDPSVEPQGHILIRKHGGGGGGGSTYTATDGLWLWPAPPTGTLELVMQWPALGFDERRTILDATRLVSLISRVQSIWT